MKSKASCHQLKIMNNKTFCQCKLIRPVVSQRRRQEESHWKASKSVIRRSKVQFQFKSSHSRCKLPSLLAAATKWKHHSLAMSLGMRISECQWKIRLKCSTWCGSLRRVKRRAQLRRSQQSSRKISRNKKCKNNNLDSSIWRLGSRINNYRKLLRR